eukprot:comp24194_c0_seq1/m.44377 comp24194_c0_seq1/g.44377  ORF comp24194_c0_seq1/g.44377 comp24194_c0_seq1/m.44377 type:complete len:504 (-) comp24194_c0_seq1:747-2258(-)
MSKHKEMLSGRPECDEDVASKCLESKDTKTSKANANLGITTLSPTDNNNDDGGESSSFHVQPLSFNSGPSQCKSDEKLSKDIHISSTHTFRSDTCVVTALNTDTRTEKQENGNTDPVGHAQQHFGNVYQRTTLVIFFIVFGFLIAMEGTLLYLVYIAAPMAPWVRFQYAYEDLRDEYTALEKTDYFVDSSTVMARQQLSKYYIAGENFNNVLQIAYAEGQVVKIYEFIWYSITLVFVVCLMLAAYKHRNHPNVRSRGHQFLAFSLCSGLLLVVSTGITSSNYLMLWPMFKYPDAQNPDNFTTITKIRFNYLHALIINISSGCFFLACFLWSMIMRQRMISYIFNHCLRRRKNLEYFEPLPIGIFLSIVMATPYIWWYFAWEMDPRKTAESCVGTIILGISMSAAFSYYTWRSRKAHLKFSDWHSNVRTIVGILFPSLGLLLFCMTWGMNTVIAHACCYSSLGRLAVNLYFTDQLVGVLVQAKYADLIPPLTQRSVSMALTKFM